MYAAMEGHADAVQRLYLFGAAIFFIFMRACIVLRCYETKTDINFVRGDSGLPILFVLSQVPEFFVRA
jgi:hypothetical protein